MSTQPPLILGLVSDLFFTVPIQNAAHALGYRVQWLDQVRDIESGAPQALAPAEPRNVGEPPTGRAAWFVAQVVEWQPALILVDLAGDQIPWPDWIAALKSSPATRRIPVVAFGPHVDLALRSRAEDVGCDVVLAKSALLRDLPGLIRKQARQLDHSALQADCRTPLSALAQAGAALFNQREFFEAHEAWEHAWNDDPGPARELYRGLLQVAVAYLQIERGNYNGALKMFLRMRQWLDPLPDVCRGVDVAQLRTDALAVRAALEALGPQRIGEFDRTLFKSVPMVGG